MARLYEYQGKQLLRTAGLTVPNGDVAATPDEAFAIARRIGKPVVVKAQVWTTGRFKAGGIRFAQTPQEARQATADLLGSRIKDFLVEKVLIEERIELAQEFYAGIIVDASHKVRATGDDVQHARRRGRGKRRRRTPRPADGGYLRRRHARCHHADCRFTPCSGNMAKTVGRGLGCVVRSLPPLRRPVGRDQSAGGRCGRPRGGRRLPDQHRRRLGGPASRVGDPGPARKQHAADRLGRGRLED